MAASASIETLEIRYPDLRVVDCAECGSVLIAESDPTIVIGMERVYHRRNERPYCGECADKWARAKISLTDRAKAITADAMAKYQRMKQGA